MPYELSEKEAIRVEGLDRLKRFDHFLEKADKENEIWTIAEGEGIAILGAEEDGEFVPIWPHQDFAMAWIGEAFGEDMDLSSLELAAIPKEVFRDEVLPEFDEAKISLLVFPTTEDDGEMMKAAELAKKLGAK